MSIIENAIIALAKIKMNRSLDLDNIGEIPSDGLREYHDIAYFNRSGKELLMDIFEPIVKEGIEHKLRHMGSDPKLIHAFPVLRPDLPESERVIDEIVDWFRVHTD